MTGEITLSGNVLPIGGIKEKFLAAKRAGVQTVIIPADNKTNVEEDLTPEQLHNVDVRYVSTIDDVLEVALPASKAELNQDAAARAEVLSGAAVPVA
jgi:ATP-dependent Lon protease